MTSQPDKHHGLELLQAATLVLESQTIPKTNMTPQTNTPSALIPKAPSTTSSLSALLNPAPPSPEHSPPPGFVIGKDGKLKKKRGRKPTPGLTDEDRRQARLLKNRRTAETSRRRKLALMNRLTVERDEAVAKVDMLKRHNEYLLCRLAHALHKDVEQMLKDDPTISSQPTAVGSTSKPVMDISDVSRGSSVADSDSDGGGAKKRRMQS